MTKPAMNDLIERLEDELTDGALFLRREAAAALRVAAEREARLVEALEPFSREGDIPEGAIPEDASLIYLSAAQRLFARDLKRAHAAIAAAKGETK